MITKACIRLAKNVTVFFIISYYGVFASNFLDILQKSGLFCIKYKMQETNEPKAKPSHKFLHTGIIKHFTKYSD